MTREASQGTGGKEKNKALRAKDMEKCSWVNASILIAYSNLNCSNMFQPILSLVLAVFEPHSISIH